jgi:hypothetical protein
MKSFLRKARLLDQDKGLPVASDTLMPGGVMGAVFGSGSIADCIHALDARSNSSRSCSRCATSTNSTTDSVV